jgi:hypothetical protein
MKKHDAFILSPAARQASGNLNLLLVRWPVQRRQLVPLIHIVTFCVLGRGQVSLLFTVASRQSSLGSSVFSRRRLPRRTYLNSHRYLLVIYHAVDTPTQAQLNCMSLSVCTSLIGICALTERQLRSSTIRLMPGYL